VRIDEDLHNLPKDLYISQLIKNNGACEEKLAKRCSKLADLAKCKDTTPIGILKDRRKSSKGSIAEKYAHDCYIISQFLHGNLSDINHMFKTSSANTNKFPADKCYSKPVLLGRSRRSS